MVGEIACNYLVFFLLTDLELPPYLQYRKHLLHQPLLLFPFQFAQRTQFFPYFVRNHLPQLIHPKLLQISLYLSHLPALFVPALFVSARFVPAVIVPAVIVPTLVVAGFVDAPF